MSDFEQERGITISTIGDDVSIGYRTNLSDGVIYSGDPSQMTPVCDGDVLTREALNDLANQLNEQRRGPNKMSVILIDGEMLGTGKAALMAKLAKENFDVVVCGTSEQTPPKDDGSIKSLSAFEEMTPQIEEFTISLRDVFVHDAKTSPMGVGRGKGDRVRRRQQLNRGRR